MSSSYEQPTTSSSYQDIRMSGETAPRGHVYHNIVAPDRAKGRSTLKFEQALQILFLVNPRTDRDVLISKKGKRVPGTFEWIIQDNKYQAWRRRDEPLLWMRGGPGKGKTVLSVFLTEELEKDNDLIYFFCVAQDDKRDNAAAVVRGLLWQLAHSRPCLGDVLVAHLETTNLGDASSLSREAVWAIFVDSVCHADAPATITCVLDGLDECDTDSQVWLMEKLSGPIMDKRSGAQKHLQLAVASRDTHEIRRIAKVSLDLDRPQANRTDIGRFVSTRLSELSHLAGFNDEFRRAVEKEMLDRASDTFLWVFYAMMELTRQTTCTGVVNTLRDLPRGLEALYTRMLRQISAEHREGSAKILRWVALAVRPLSLSMLATALGTRATELLSVQQVLRDQIEHCSPFVVIDPLDHTARLVHESARDYLLGGKAKADETLQDFHFSSEEEHLRLASACLASLNALYRLTEKLEKSRQWLAEIQQKEMTRRYLRATRYREEQEHEQRNRLKRLEQRQQLEERHRLELEEWLEQRGRLTLHDWLEQKERLDQKQWHERRRWLDEEVRRESDQPIGSLNYPMPFRFALATESTQGTKDFLWYAILCWPNHARAANSYAARLENAHGQFFRNDSDVRQKWFHAYHQGSHLGLADPSWTTFQVVCYLGITALARKLLLRDRKEHINERGFLRNTSLHWAASGGHLETVRMLLENGGDASAVSESGKTALQIATEQGHSSTAELLREHLTSQERAAV